jgi:predicted adenine nucleotide alpha hydrolase (AANH) superfamily ATPase
MSALLLHICCAHCGAYTIKFWQNQGYAITAFWYNPNIHPFLEHQHRLQAVRQLTDSLEIPLVENPSYDLPNFFHAIRDHELDRCRYCFELRLSCTANIAKNLEISAYTTTLLISPYQKHDLVKTSAESISSRVGIPFLYADLRKRFSDSRRLTKPLNLFSQQYCGCLYSEWERYRENPLNTASNQ